MARRCHDKVAVAALLVTVFYLLVASVTGEMKFVGEGGSLEERYGGGPVLLSFGEETRTVTVLHRDAEGREVRDAVVRGDGGGVWKAGEVRTEEGVAVEGVEGAWRNVTVPFVFEEGVGVAPWELAVTYTDGQEEVVKGEWIVAGVVIRDSAGEIVSGIGRNEVEVGDGYQGGHVELSIDAVGLDGKPMPSGEEIDVVIRDSSGKEYRQVDKGASVKDGKLTFDVEKWRVGSGKLTAEIDAPGLEMDGESFETEVNFHIGGDKTRGDVAPPPPVVVADKIVTNEKGVVEVTMFNLLSPPAKEDVRECVMQIGGEEIKMDEEKTRLTQPDQLLVFVVGDRAGDGKIICDGRTAEVVGGEDGYGGGGGAFAVPMYSSGRADDAETHESSSTEDDEEAGARASPEAEGENDDSDVPSTLDTHMPDDKKKTGETPDEDDAVVVPESGAKPSGANSSGVLAIDDLESSLPEKSGSVRLMSRLRVVNADPSTYTVNEAADVLEAVCFFTDGSDCSLVNVTKGSAILDIENYVDEGKDKEAAEKLREAVEGCELQKRIQVACDAIELNEARVAEAAVTADGRDKGDRKKGGVSKLAIVLSSVCGAIALIALVVAALWVVYRRNAEQTESDFSSSGPLGVPETNDVLYQQAIVRDIYGRGDFSASGGITVERAEQSRREADLREVTIGPPSSSGASSFLSRHTDEVSSTYSV